MYCTYIQHIIAKKNKPTIRHSHTSIRSGRHHPPASSSFGTTHRSVLTSSWRSWVNLLLLPPRLRRLRPMPDPRRPPLRIQPPPSPACPSHRRTSTRTTSPRSSTVPTQ